MYIFLSISANTFFSTCVMFLSNGCTIQFIHFLGYKFVVQVQLYPHSSSVPDSGFQNNKAA